MTDLEREIYTALLLARPGDLREFEKYIKWILVRRRVNRHFYFQAHWVTRPPIRAHWIRRYTE